MTYRYTCTSPSSKTALRPIVAHEDVPAKDVVQQFADRIARQHYGRTGYARTLRLDSYTPGGTSIYEAFIGYNVGEGTTGHNITLYVDAAPAND